jgi:TPP-dependent pyruvate/acetoin dehydrogenase alpha subunit
VEAWLARDPIPLYRAKLLSANTLTEAQAEQITANWRRDIAAAAKRAASAPWADARQDFSARLFA